jgi:SAM-dependent methyltransferase
MLKHTASKTMFQRLMKRLRPLSGYVDVLDRYHVSGWAANSKGLPPKLTVRSDGQIVGTFSPKYPRPDLFALYGKRAQSLGFDYAFLNPVDEGATITITDDYDRQLMSSPRAVPAEPKLDLSSVTHNLSTPIPGADLVFLVVGHRNRQQFALDRRPPVDYITSRLTAAGIDYTKFDSILDFGCGCGRILAGWEGILPSHTKLMGCDINPKLIDFCQTNISFAKTFVSNFLPPLPVSDGALDLVYAASVFTHLTLPATNAWAGEMARILKPRGILILSFHGSSFETIVGDLSSAGLQQLRQTGFYCHVYGSDLMAADLGSNDYASFMTADFVIKLFEDFEIIELTQTTTHGPTPFMSNHDIAILRRIDNARS